MTNYIPAPYADILDGPGFPGAECIGHHRLFDGRAHGESNNSVTYRHHDAANICQTTCPVLTECDYWFTNLPTNERPAGVVAGHIPPLSAERGRPRKQNQ